MLKKRIIPCLDIDKGRTVKGTNFINIRDAGDPIELAKIYSESGADELVFLDITASVERRKTLIPLVEKIALHINIPFTVGGGIKSLDDAKAIIEAGADKVTINSAAVENPQLITEISKYFGSQCLVLAIDTKKEKDDWYVYTQGGRNRTELKCLDWAIRAEQLGAGEILLTSMNSDGTKAGFETDLVNQICSEINIPLIASGGAGSMEHFEEVLKGKASAALAASVFHFGEIAIPDLKEYLKTQEIPIR